MTEAVSYRVEGGVAWLTIERPEARNALNAAVREGLWAGARRFNEDDTAKVLVLTGAGEKAFCAGGDLKEMAGTALTVPPPDFVPQFGRNIDVPKPTIAAVNGVAYAGGFLLAQQCDLVSRDADGYLYYVDRIDDMIVTGGENVFPQMVEEHLAACPDLAEVAVIGTAHERWVEQVTAVVVPVRPGVTADDVAAWCAANPNLSGMHRPRRIEVVDALPRTGSGKLNRPELRKLYP